MFSSASASDHYHASGCGQYVYKRISSIKHILPYHLHLQVHVLNNQSMVRYVNIMLYIHVLCYVVDIITMQCMIL